MNIKIKVKSVGSDQSWDEVYDTGDKEPEEFAKDLIDNFNNTLRPGEKARELIGWVKTEEKSRAVLVQHDWDKVSLMTEEDKDGMLCDRMRCTKCGITGKRYGLGMSGTRRDPKFKHQRFANCDKAKEYFERKRERENVKVFNLGGRG